MYVIIKGLVTNFQQACSRYLGKAISSDVICFSTGKPLLSGRQMMCRSIQFSALSLGVSCVSKILFLGVWCHKGWLAVLDRGLSSEVE